mgnify:CR=1 FL=1
MGFDVSQVIDNKKSWVSTGATDRTHSTTPLYTQEDSRLLINKKEIDMMLDATRGCDYDLFY